MKRTHIVCVKHEIFIVDPEIFKNQSAKVLSTCATTHDAIERLTTELPFVVLFPPASKTEMRKWLNDNCTDQWHFWHEVRFKSERDAILFKMFFS